MAAGRLPVVAVELCHERAGRHTCDRRLPRAALAQQVPSARVPRRRCATPMLWQFPSASFALIEEEDPYWGDGLTREPWEVRAAR